MFFPAGVVVMESFIKRDVGLRGMIVETSEVLDVFRSRRYVGVGCL